MSPGLPLSALRPSLPVSSLGQNYISLLLLTSCWHVHMQALKQAEAALATAMAHAAKAESGAAEVLHTLNRCARAGKPYCRLRPLQLWTYAGSDTSRLASPIMAIHLLLTPVSPSTFSCPAGGLPSRDGFWGGCQPATLGSLLWHGFGGVMRRVLTAQKASAEKAAKEAARQAEKERKAAEAAEAKRYPLEDLELLAEQRAKALAAGGSACKACHLHAGTECNSVFM